MGKRLVQWPTRVCPFSEGLGGSGNPYDDVLLPPEPLKSSSVWKPQSNVPNMVEP